MCILKAFENNIEHSINTDVKQNFGRTKYYLTMQGIFQEKYFV